MAKTQCKLESRSTKANSNKPTRKFPYNRNLKVRKSFYNYHYGDFQPRPYRVPKEIPWINIQGLWLNEAGFTVGTELSVKISKGRIVVTSNSG